MKSYHRHQKQARNHKNKNSKLKNKRNETVKNKSKTGKKSNDKVTAAPSDKLKHLKIKRQKASKRDELLNINATLSIQEMDELNNYIHEYLTFHGYDATLNEFEKERISNSYTQIKLQHNLMNRNIINDDAMRNEILNKIISMFDVNDINGIFKIWNRYLSTEILNNNAYAIKLECHLHIFKFVMQFNQYQTINNNHQKMNKKYTKSLNDIRSELQSYFNDNGQRLALCQDVLPYFSLPYIDNAQTHPIFAQFFEPEFSQNLRYTIYLCFLYMFIECNFFFDEGRN